MINLSPEVRNSFWKRGLEEGRKDYINGIEPLYYSIGEFNLKVSFSGRDTVIDSDNQAQTSFAVGYMAGHRNPYV